MKTKTTTERRYIFTPKELEDKLGITGKIMSVYKVDYDFKETNVEIIIVTEEKHA